MPHCIRRTVIHPRETLVGGAPAIRPSSARNTRPLVEAPRTQAGHGTVGFRDVMGFSVTESPKAVYLGLFTWAGEGASHHVLESLSVLARILGSRVGKDEQGSQHSECRLSLWCVPALNSAWR